MTRFLLPRCEQDHDDDQHQEVQPDSTTTAKSSWARQSGRSVYDGSVPRLVRPLSLTDEELRMTAFLGINPSRFAIVKTLLDETAPLPTSEVVERTGLAYHVVSKHLLDLERGSFIEATTPDPIERRAAAQPALWVFTDTARETLNTLYNGLYRSG